MARVLPHRETTMTFEETIDKTADAYRYGVMAYTMGEQADKKHLRDLAPFKLKAIEKGIGDWNVYQLAMHVIAKEEKGEDIDPFYIEILSWRRKQFNTSLVKAFPARPPIEPQKLFPGYEKYDTSNIK